MKRCGRGRKGVQKVCSTKGYPLGVSFMVRDSVFRDFFGCQGQRFL